MADTIFKDWTQSDGSPPRILCPDLNEGADLKLQGQESSMVTNNIEFKISFCNST